MVHTGGTCVLWSGRAVGIQDTGKKRKILKRSRSLLEFYDFLISLTTYDKLSSVMVACVKGSRPSRFSQKINTFFQTHLELLSCLNLFNLWDFSTRNDKYYNLR